MVDVIRRTATELAELIRDREVSAEEVLQAHLEQIAAHDGSLNAVVTLDEESARRRAREADEALARGELWGPLHGVPLTVKDCFETAGLRTTSGFPPLRDHVPSVDASVVARLRAAGAVLMGKTNLSLLATDWQTDNPIFGRTRNPWDPDRTCGGSSGGSAAAVAAGFTPLEFGSDIGGSIRVPAHYCGIYGLKPTEHRVPSTGHIPDWHIPGMTPPGLVRHMGVYGPLARSVADLRLCFQVTAGPDGTAHQVPPVTPAPDGAAPDVDGLRIAWSDQFADAVVSDDTRATVSTAASRLSARGARVERIDPPIDYPRLWRTWGEIVGAEVGGSLSFLLRNALRLQFLLMPDRSPIRKGMLRGTRLRVGGLARCLAFRDEAISLIDRAIESFDAWICPVAATPAFTHRKPGRAIEVGDRRLSYFLATGGYTTPFNLSGHPVVVLPAGRSDEGLPIGVQLVGKRWRDEQLLSAAESIDAVIGDLRHPAAYHGS